MNSQTCLLTLRQLRAGQPRRITFDTHRLTGQQVREAMQGHILAQASLTGIYSLNPSLKL